MMNKLAGVFVIGIAFASNQLTEASTNRIPMSVSEGQSLVERFFAETEFNTGDWGNDISLLLPFKWVSAQDEKHTFFSMAEHKRTYEADWFVEQIVDGRLRYLKYKFSPETDVTFMPQELCEVQYSDGRQCLCYYSCLANGKPGVSSIRDLILSYYTIVRAERLPCETVNVLDKGSPK